METDGLHTFGDARQGALQDAALDASIMASLKRVKTRVMTLPLWDAKNSNRKALRIFDARQDALHDARHDARHDASIMACLTREAPLDAVIVGTA